jgi:hypothetical protein
MTEPIEPEYDAEYEAAVRQAGPPCKCSHAESRHSTTTGYCWSAACGCRVYRPREEKAPAPRPAAPAPVRRGLPELVVCPECNGSGQGLLPDDPDYRWYWCPRCYGAGVVEDEQ